MSYILLTYIPSSQFLPFTVKQIKYASYFLSSLAGADIGDEISLRIRTGA